MEVRRLAALALLLAGPLGVDGCGANAVGVDACRRIEEARCRRAPACGVPIEPPFFTSGNDVDACVRYYDDACLHGLAGNDPGLGAVNACVAAIQSANPQVDGGCDVVKSPQSDVPACGWLMLSASAAADASDALTTKDASSD